jgi:hypothetical protein
MKISHLYVPGMISLLVLLPLTLYQFTERLIPKPERTLEITWYTPDMPDYYGMHAPQKRNYIPINLTGNEADDNTKIHFARRHVRNMIASYDTLTGVHIHFHDKSKYELFIRILEVCDRKDTLQYTAYENDFWIFNAVQNKQPEELKFRFVCGTSYMKWVKAADNKIDWVGYVYDRLPYFLFVSSAFVVLGVLGIRKAVKQKL